MVKWTSCNLPVVAVGFRCIPVGHRRCCEAIVNVGFGAVGMNSWNSALSSKEGLGQLQLSAIDRFGAVNGCIAAKPSPRH